MSKHTGRRQFLKVSGALLGGIAAGTTVTAATSRDRFLVDSKKVRDTSDVEIVHDIDPIDLLVVEGNEERVKKLGGKYVPDLVYVLDEPVESQEQSATDEPLYPLQWDKQDQDIPETQEITRGEGTRVAIIDSGVDATHVDLQHAVNEELSRNFTGDNLGAPGPYGGDHGTHVAGIVAANDRNETGVVGSAPGTEIIDCRVFSSAGGASFGDIIAAAVYSAEIGCDAANMSIGAYPVDRRGNGSFYGGMLNKAMTYVNSQGTLPVVSAGNDSADLQHDNGEVLEVDTDGDGELEELVLEGGHWISLPNEAAQALSIAATGPVGFGWGEDGLEEPPESPAFYTNYGTNAVDLAAPGGDADVTALDNEVPGADQDLVLSTVPGNRYDYKAGTSMAAPQVTGAAALVKSVNPDYNANQVQSTLENTAEVPDDYNKAYYGAGYLDTFGAVTGKRRKPDKSPKTTN